MEKSTFSNRPTGEHFFFFRNCPNHSTHAEKRETLSARLQRRGSEWDQAHPYKALAWLLGRNHRNCLQDAARDLVWIGR